MSKLNERIRKAIEASKLSRYAIAKQSGVSASMLCRFMARQRELSTEAIEKLADALALEIIIRPKRQRKAR